MPFYKQILLLCLILPFSLQAAWFEGEGIAPIFDGNIETARKQAVQDALLSLMYQGGASIRSLQVVKAGVLETDNLTVRTNGEVHDMRLLQEKIKDNLLYVTVRADIYALNNCQNDDYAKTLFMGPIMIQKREHAQLGALYKAGEELAERLFYRLNQDTKKIEARHLMTRKIVSNDRYYQDIETQMLNLSRDLATQYDVQYILFGNIEDMSSYNETTTQLLVLEKTTKKRNFQLQLYLIDALNRETLFRKNYSSNRPWEFDITERLDLNSSRFWSSEYGLMVNGFLNQAVRNVSDTLYCQPTLSSIVAVYDNQVVINIGGKNGVRRGDRFQLVHQQFVLHQDGGTQGPIFSRDEIQFTVNSVQSDRAILTPDKVSQMANVQIRDLLLPIENKDNF